ncbi:hypothetical protein NUM_43820 [Actinocatenispora comari]|uniref:HTH cro/C1-type domain-containing protein n=1 Tax=Actinocatenispora comari TaxID=2807577 RepID=A0A8J4ADN1_9ACTN|nr:hypothetical protein NUM_43820 [Actinocatenispora comari]
MLDHYDPMLMQRMLAVRLRQLRYKTGLSQRQTALRTEWSINKVNRIENADSTISITDLNALLGLYRLTDPQDDETLRDWARRARQPGWTSPYAASLDLRTRRHLAYQTSASRILMLDTLLIPDLLRTDDFNRHVRRATTGGAPPTDQQHHLYSQIDATRRAQLAKRADRELRVVIDEAVLLRPFGSIDTTINQLQYLRRLTETGTL